MTYIIAEIGVNHNGDLALAKKLVDAAKKAGADAAKFQIFYAEDIVSPDAPKADYQIKNGSSGKSQYEMLKSLELTATQLKTLKTYCEKKGIDFLASAFGNRELDFYADELGVKTVKFGSGELTNAPLIFAAAQKEMKIILSTGMADLKDIKFALGVIACGYTAPKGTVPTPKMIKDAYKSRKGVAALKKNVLIMQCTTQYPCPDDAVNLRAMVTIAKKFGLPVGFSDHSGGLGLGAASVALGAEMIEKHLTLDKSMEGPDHKASLDIQEFTQYVKEIRSVEKGLGNGKKNISHAARKIANVACKKIIATRDIKKGETLSIENMATRRMGAGGLNAESYYELIGKKSTAAYKKGGFVYG